MMEPFDPLIAAKTVLDQENIAPVRMDKVGHIVGQPLILLSLVDVRRMVRHRLEVAEFVAHCYSEYKDEALMLALRARNALLNVPMRAVPGAVITDSHVVGPQDFPDEDSGEQRFLLSFSLFYYETGG